jgi:hypothetical protein
VPDEWHKEQYLRPGQWIPWVGVTMLGTMVALAGVVLVLHLNGKVRFRWSGGVHRIMSTLTRDNYSFFSCIFAVSLFVGLISDMTRPRKPQVGPGKASPCEEGHVHRYAVPLG